MDLEQESVNSNIKPPIQNSDNLTPVHHKKNPFFITIGIIVFLIVGAFLINQIYNNSLKTDNDKTKSLITPTSVQDKQSNDINLKDPFLKQESLDNSHVIEIYSTNSTDKDSKCKVKLKTINGVEISLSNLIENNEISCRYGQGEYYTGFQSWVSENKLIIISFDIPGEVKIVDPINNKIETFKYDSDKYSFVAVNKDLNRWLLQQKDVDEGLSYLIFDKNNVVVKDDIRFGGLISGNNREYYDALNDTFLFIFKQNETIDTKNTDYNVNEEKFVIRFETINSKNLILKNIFKSDPVQLAGRGCYAEEISSEPGFIIIKSNSAGCIFNDNKYFDSNNEFRLKLTP